jgi:hypothetical protein
MKIFITGKVTGLSIEDYSDKFNSAEEYLHLLYPSATILNPLRITSHLNPTIHGWREYMMPCLEELLKLEKDDFVFVLDNFNESKGSKVEIAVAKACELKIIYQ